MVNKEFMAVPRILPKLNTFNRKFEEAVLSLGIIVLAIFLIINAIARKAGLLMPFVEELSMFLVIFVTFTGLSYAVRKARHIRMAAIYDFMPEKIQKAMILIISFVSALFMFYMAYLAIIYLLFTHSMGQVTPVLRMAYWIGIIIVPVGFSLSGIQYVLAFTKNISRKEIWLSAEEQSEYK